MNRKQAFLARLTEEDIAVMMNEVESVLPGDYPRGLYLHEALIKRIQTYRLYGRDERKEYFQTVDEIMQDRSRERQQLDETTRQESPDATDTGS